MSQLPRLLDFAIVGAAKSGTSSLSALLHQHPGAHIMQPKDAHFFSGVSAHPQWNGPTDEVFNERISEVQHTYPSQLAALDSSLKVGDASVFYMADPEALRALHGQLASDGIVIAVLRRPDERAYSAYMHMVRQGLEDGDFRHGLDREDQRRTDNWQPLWWYRSLGYYSSQVENLYEIFGPERVYVLRFEDVLTHTRETLEPVLERLGLQWIPTELNSYNRTGVPKNRALQNFLSKKHVIKTLGKKVVPLRWWLRARHHLERLTLQRVQMPANIGEELVRNYREDVANLEELTGLDLADWKSVPERQSAS